MICVVTLTDLQVTREYPCRSKEKALELASHFMSSLLCPLPKMAFRQDVPADACSLDNVPAEIGWIG